MALKMSQLLENFSVFGGDFMWKVRGQKYFIHNIPSKLKVYEKHQQFDF